MLSGGFSETSQAGLAEAEIAPFGHDHVVHHPNPDQLSRGDKPIGDRTILAARIRIPARVVVHEQKRRSRSPDRLPKHLPRMHQARRQRANRYLLLREEPVPPVQKQDVKGLAFRARESRLEMSLDVGGAPNRTPALEGFPTNPLGKLERRQQARRLCRADARHATERGRRSHSEIDEPSESLEQRARERARTTRPAPGPKHQCDQLDVRKRSRTEPSETLTGLVAPNRSARSPNLRISADRSPVEPGHPHAVPPSG